MRKQAFYLGFVAILIIGLVIISGCGTGTKQTPARKVEKTPEPSEPSDKVIVISGGATAVPAEPKKTTPAPQAPSNLYKNSVYGFSIEYPKGWEVEESVSIAGITAIVAFLGPINKDFQTNINIKTENAQGYTLDQYIEASKQLLSQFLAMNDYLLIKEGSLTINNQKAYFLEYAFNLEGYPLKTKQVILMNRDNAYIVTYTALQTTFENTIKDFDKSISTFKFNV